VLEIGAGSGYMAALLATRRESDAVELSPELKALAEKNLADNGVTNVTVELGNGAQGWSSGAPFDVIVVSGSLPVLPEALLQQLKVGGRLAVIIGQAPAMKAQLITRTGEAGYDTRTLFETNVKPLASAVAPSQFKF
jgi:protein-L-isoaspartate(D-aspartate) O-methyltransferase